MKLSTGFLLVILFVFVRAFDGTNRTQKSQYHHKRHRISNRYLIRTTTPISKRNTQFSNKFIQLGKNDADAAQFTPVLTETPSIPVTNAQVQSINITVKVGETVLLGCAINATFGQNPGVIWMQGKVGNVLTLNANRITIDARFEIIQNTQGKDYASEINQVMPSSFLFNPSHEAVQQQLKIVQQSSPLEMDSQLKQTDLSFYHLRINNVQLYDENEYVCQTSLTKQNEDQPSVHSIINLQVTQSPSFIESLTSESNLAALDQGDAILKCFAIGKPNPKIKWYKIEEDGSIKDLNHESNSLTVRNISKNDFSKYECIAGNGILPSVSKKFTLTVYFTPILTPIRKTVYQYVGQTVLLGCIVNSNPDSTITWYKSNIDPKSGNTTSEDYVKIDSSNQPKYQIHKFKQTNQTVSYFKIKNLEPTDYTYYKCEAANIVGISEAVIELLDIQETPSPSSTYLSSSPISVSTPNHLKKSHKNNHHKSSKNNKIKNSYTDFKTKKVEIYESEEETNNEENYHYDSHENDEFNYVEEEPQDEELNESTNRRINGNKHVTNSIKKKQLQKHSRLSGNNNRTLFKYQINKSNRFVENENSLQRMNDLVTSKASSSSVDSGAKNRLHLLKNTEIFVLSIFVAFLLKNHF